MANPREPADPPHEPSDDVAHIQFERDVFEFGRAVNFFDATFAIATTLLVTTLATGSGQWSSWPAFRHAVTGPLFAYALSFAVVCRFWWSNHQFVSSLKAMTPRIVGASIVMLAFVVLIPFSTSGLGTTASGEVPTVVYAVNVAAVSLTIFALQRLALAQRLYITTPTKEEVLERTISILDTPAVFLLSVPIALLWSANAAKYFWLTLLLAGLIEHRWFARRRASTSTRLDRRTS